MKLNKVIADKVCTAVVLGYAEQVGEDRGTVKFEYLDPEDAEAYCSVKKWFKDLGVRIDIGTSKRKENLPCIAATGTAVWNRDRLKTIGEVEHALAVQIDRYMKDNNITGQYGAYVGGVSQIEKVLLVGASALALATPEFREVDSAGEARISGAYDRAREVAKKIFGVLGDVEQKIKGVHLDGKFSPYPDYEFGKGKVFKSYHGMIQAMVRYQTLTMKNNFFFEIAAGDKTDKVSSCFPCSTFMTVSDKSVSAMPPTSMHLGRGDYWNIPRTSGGSAPMRESCWQKQIKVWYDLGKKRMGQKGGVEVVEVEGQTDINVHGVFLEALTFESSFIDKIKSALNKSGALNKRGWAPLCFSERMEDKCCFEKEGKQVCREAMPDVSAMT